MSPDLSRRKLLATLPVLALAGCTGGAREDEGTDETATETSADAGEVPTDDTTTATPTQTEEPMTPGDNSTPTDDSSTATDRAEQLEKLPEPSPLVVALEDLVAAADRQAVAADRGIEFREQDHSARVSIELESEQELPDGYRVDVVSQYAGHVTAYVHVDDLVPLAIEDAVRKIGRPPESKTHTGSTLD
jgi:hypothetical protein